MPELPGFGLERPGREGMFLFRTHQERVSGAAPGAFAALAGAHAARTGKEALRALHGARVQVPGATIEGPAGVRALPDTIEARWLPALYRYDARRLRSASPCPSDGGGLPC